MLKILYSGTVAPVNGFLFHLMKRCLMALAKDSRYIVGPVQKALEVLLCLAEERRELTLGEIQYRVRLPKTTVFRYLHTLGAAGFVTYDANTELYRVGLRMWELGQLSSSLVQIRVVAQPLMRELRDACNETVNLGTIEGQDIVYLDMVESRRSLRMQAQPGIRDPVYSTALGKAMLAFMLPEHWANHLPRVYEARTARTVPSFAQLEKELALIQQRGYSLDDEENEEGARCIGAPIFDGRGTVIAAISLSAPVSRLSEQHIAPTAERTMHIAQAISQLLGYSPKEQ